MIACKKISISPSHQAGDLRIPLRTFQRQSTWESQPAHAISRTRDGSTPRLGGRWHVLPVRPSRMTKSPCFSSLRLGLDVVPDDSHTSTAYTVYDLQIGA